MRFFISMLFSCCAVSAAQFTNSTSLALQTAFTNFATVTPGSTIWVRGGTYSPLYTNANSLGETQWFLHLTNVTIRSYPGEVAKFDLQWRFGTSRSNTFRDLEFFDTRKGTHHTNLPTYPNGPWLHFDDATSAGGHQWVNNILHDTCNLWSGWTSGQSIRGNIIWNVGLNALEHVCYPGGEQFVGNISLWHFENVINGGFTYTASNIIAGAGQTSTDAGGSDLQMSGAIVIGNRFWNRYYTDRLATPVRIGSEDGGTSNRIVFTNNTVVGAQPFKNYSSSNMVFRHNTVQMNQAFGAYPVWHRFSTNGIFDVDYNAYTSITPQDLVFEDETAPSVRRTFAQWKSFTGFDANSTGTNGSVPPNAVHVYPNADEPKRAHIAVYNFSSNNTVSVNLAGVLSLGDHYIVKSAQDFNGPPVQRGQFNGSTITLPMTNLAVAPVLYGQNWGLVNPPATSPEFAAFVVMSAPFQTTISGPVQFSGPFPAGAIQ